MKPVVDRSPAIFYFPNGSDETSFIFSSYIDTLSRAWAGEETDITHKAISDLYCSGTVKYSDE